MIDEIFNEYQDKRLKSSKDFAEKIGMPDNLEVMSIFPKKNFDLALILNQVADIPEEVDTLSKLNEFYDDLFKFGIDCGIGVAKKLTIDALLQRKISIREIKALDPEKYVDFKFDWYK